MSNKFVICSFLFKLNYKITRSEADLPCTSSIKKIEQERCLSLE